RPCRARTAGIVFLQKQIEREVKAALGEPACAAMAGCAAFGEQLWRRFALVEILRDGHRSAQRDYHGKSKQTAARFDWRHQFFRYTADERAACGGSGKKRKMAGDAQSAVQAWRKVGVLPPSLRCNRGVEQRLHILSIWRLLPLPLRPCRLHPPREIIGKARKRV